MELPRRRVSLAVPVRDNRYPHDMLAGIAVQLGYLVVFGAAALVYFKRKDIRS